MIGLTDGARRKALDSGAVGNSRTQAFTNMNSRGYAQETTDPRPRIFLNNSAFRGGAYSLREVLVHEFLHIAGWPADSGFGRHFRATDLSYHDHYDEIMDACK